jgi:hypothetical protein
MSLFILLWLSLFGVGFPAQFLAIPELLLNTYFGFN